MPYDVFLSHSSKDKALADDICRFLESRGLVCWIAPRDIAPGEDWSAAIVEGIHASKALVLLLSEHANASPQVRREVQRGCERGLHVVPVRLAEVVLPPALEYYLSSIHWLDAVDGVHGEALEALHRRLAAALGPATVPAEPAPAPPPAPAAPRHNLPHLATSFVGREKPLADLRALLPTARLLTLVGPGGTGKTRLSLQVAVETLADFPDGAWFVELAPVDDPDRVPQAVAEALGVRESAAEPLAQTLAGHLETARALLILDNCEHLVGACARLAEGLLRRCPDLRILASSREALNIPGERAVPLPPLSLPDPGIRHSPEKLLTFEAVRLFAERAQAVRPDFAVTTENAMALTAVCRRLDGIPLAIELAAARVRAMTVPEIHQRLDQRFRLLTGGSRTALPRQQTLRALIDWSVDLLADSEKVLLHRLSVFVDGWDMEAAEAVCAGDPVEEWEVVDLLASLVDKSLAAAQTQGTAARYGMLESVRAYALEKLAGSGAEADLRARHGAHFREMAAHAGAALGDGAAPEAWLTRLDDERANLNAAMNALSGDEAARMCLDLEEYWDRRGLWREAGDRMEEAGQRVADPALHARLLATASWLAYLHGDLPRARSLAQRSREMAQAQGYARGEAMARNTLAFVAWRDGDREAAREGFEASLALLREAGEPDTQANLSNLGLLSAEMGDLERAQAHLEEARALYTVAGDSRGIGFCLCNLADLALRRGDPRSARACAEESLAIFEERHDLPGSIYSRANLAEAALRLDDPAEADAQAREALTRCRSEEMRALLPLLLELRVRALAALGKARAAHRCLAAADAVRDLLDMPRTDEEAQAIAAAAANMAEVPEAVRARHRAVAVAAPTAPWTEEDDDDD